MTRFQKYIKQVEEGDQGFTLIELMVVVLIIGILMAIAIPTFLGAKNSANAKAAQENVRNLYTDEAAAYSNNQQYSDTLSALQAAEANMTVAGTPSSTNAWTANTVYVSTDTGASPPNDAVQIAALGKDNKCYYLEAVAGTVYYGIGTYASATTSCAAPSAWDTSWGGSAVGTPPAPGGAFVAAAG